MVVATIDSPFPRARVNIGKVEGDGGVWACFENMDGDGFTWFKLGGSAGLSEDFAIPGGNGTGQGDWVTVRGVRED